MKKIATSKFSTLGTTFFDTVCSITENNESSIGALKKISTKLGGISHAINFNQGKDLCDLFINARCSERFRYTAKNVINYEVSGIDYEALIIINSTSDFRKSYVRGFIDDFKLNCESHEIENLVIAYPEIIPVELLNFRGLLFLDFNASCVFNNESNVKMNIVKNFSLADFILISDHDLDYFNNKYLGFIKPSAKLIIHSPKKIIVNNQIFYNDFFMPNLNPLIGAGDIFCQLFTSNILSSGEIAKSIYMSQKKISEYMKDIND